MTETQKPSVHDRLLAIHRKGASVAGPQFYIYREGRGRQYLSGVPHLWSAFAERAFVFADESQARAVVDEFAGQDEMAGACVGSWAR